MRPRLHWPYASRGSYGPNRFRRGADHDVRQMSDKLRDERPRIRLTTLAHGAG
jgi:hypothetical protein